MIVNYISDFIFVFLILASFSALFFYITSRYYTKHEQLEEQKELETKYKNKY